MFGTLHWNSRTKEPEFVERPDGSSDPEKNSACNRCRAKKVKCSITLDGCSRCKRIGKTCIFSSMKQKGDQRVRKTSSMNSPPERSLDLLIQSSASPSPREARSEESVTCEKQLLASPFSTNGNCSPDDGERGQKMLVDTPTDHTAAAISPTNFDLSFLAELGYPTGNSEGGDNFYNLSFSPLPFFSPYMRNPHHEPTPPAATVAAVEPLLSPALSSADEMPLYFPCTKDSPLFDMEPNTTPTPINTSNFAATAFPVHNPSVPPCQCLAAVTFAVEEFEAGCTSGNRAQLDSIVAYQKEAIKRCRAMLKCTYCMAKRENLVLLVFMTEKIVSACASIVVLYRTKDCDMTSSSAPSPLPFSHGAAHADRDLSTSPSASSSRPGSLLSGRSGWQELLLGDYEISSHVEWEHLVRVLIALQFRAVMELLTDIKAMGRETLGETQTASLAQAERSIAALEKDIYLYSINAGPAYVHAL